MASVRQDLGASFRLISPASFVPLRLGQNWEGLRLAGPLQIETRSIDYVPLAERHGHVWRLWPIWFTGDAHLATLATGAISVSMGLSLGWSALAILAGGALGSFFMAFHSTQGPQMGLPQMIQSRPQFGYLGALLVWGVALFTYVGFSAFNQLLAGDTLHLLTHAPPSLAFAPVVGVSVLIAVIGYRFIHTVQLAVAGLMIIILALFTLGAFFVPDLLKGLATLGPFRMVPFLVQFFAAAAYQLSWSIYVSDYSRYLPKDVGVAASFWWTFTGALIGGAWMMLVGALAAAFAPKLDIVQAFMAAGDAMRPGFGLVALLASFVGLITITSLNLYGAALTLLSMADSLGVKKLSRARLSALVVVSGVSVAIAYLSPKNIMEAYENLLSILLYLFTPWTAINLVDFYWVRKAHYSIREIFNPKGLYGRWSWRGLAAYALGMAAMVPFFSTDVFKGPVAAALGGADVSMLIGLPVSGLAYVLFCRSLDLAAERERAFQADLGLEP